MEVKECLVLGNSPSRLSIKEFIKTYSFDIFGCNRAFNESNYINFTAISTVHDFVVNEAYSYKIRNKLSYEILYREKILNICSSFIESHGYSSGSEAIIEAINRGFNRIMLCGFSFIDSRSDDIYSPGISLYTGNFIKQWSTIQETYGEKVVFKFL